MPGKYVLKPSIWVRQDQADEVDRIAKAKGRLASEVWRALYVVAFRFLEEEKKKANVWLDDAMEEQGRDMKA
jgi:hypothetical protein